MLATTRFEAALAAARGQVAHCALRVNPDVDPKTHPYISTGLKGNKFGVAHDRTAHRNSLALTPGQGPRLLLQRVGEAEDVCRLANATLDLTTPSVDLKVNGMDSASLDDLGNLLPPDLSDRPRFGADERAATPHILLVIDGGHLPGIG